LIQAVGRGAPNNHGRSKDLNFGFDRVFDPYSTQYEVFQHTTRNLISEVLNGFNCTCFAYGATGAGKTFTMIGNKENPGVMVLTMQELFAAMEDQSNTTYDVSISYLEIYNETIRDLLVKASKPLDLRESADAGFKWPV
jgi:kinesin family member 18/19